MSASVSTSRSRPRFKLKRPVAPEFANQRAIVKFLSIEIAPPGRLSPQGVCWWAIDQSDYGGAVPGTRVSRGCIAGICDLFILFLGQVGFVELKAGDNPLSDAQRSVASAILGAGGRVAVAENVDDIAAIVDFWKVPRLHRVHL